MRTTFKEGGVHMAKRTRLVWRWDRIFRTGGALLSALAIIALGYWAMEIISR